MAVEVGSELRGDVRVITLRGEIDGASAPSAQEAAVAALPERGVAVLDMSEVAYMSSAGLRMLLLLYRHAEGKGTRVALAGLGVDLQDVMDATGFLAYFTVADDVDGAVAAIGAE